VGRCIPVIAITAQMIRSCGIKGDEQHIGEYEILLFSNTAVSSTQGENTNE
jgi:hypothetical protein